MQIHLVAKDRLEAEGIRWIVESHLSGSVMTTFASLEEYIQQVDKNSPDLLLLDMDGWTTENNRLDEQLQQANFRWIGISSERIFQTAYRGLRFHAEDVLFRPFSPTDLIKQIQQVRYQLRNAQRQNAMRMNIESTDASIDYADLFFLERERAESITMAAFLPKQSSVLPSIYDELQRFSFTKKHQLFALTDFILCVHDTHDKVFFQEEYRTFLGQWKERVGEPLAIVYHESAEVQSIKKTFEQTKERTEEIFFEGYDIILSTNQQVHWLPMDPFLTPLEQRQWIEMLETRDVKRIRHWVEKEFLTYQRPYPDPEMVRIRMTSVLAQIRRYMKSYQLQTDEWESAYYAVFQQIIQSPIIYEMVQDLLAFTIRLFSDETANVHLRNGEQSLVEKTRALIEANYWDAGWGLANCAEALRINKSTLSRRFAAESDQPFRVVLHRVRIEEAKRLLQETDLSIEEISRLVGYVHQSYFSAKFKQFENCTPFAYRMR
ncbi:helix-turn-helix domain-containing protein [Sporosarcina sp. ACRSM]|uniref:response regulator transcription factor n=1 Tax=Sporosarcina sp. ACRSM TaxID=2918216 RepID=UPI001EF6AD92|nr:response regulator transcription factor [Sporosarcina sp. ACRSM]MCG7335740.1 helix-turn-helix domain-containing protein [Sporosarcina sp. ACRSM]